MNVTTPYRLAPGVAIRSERFGALVYHHDTRRLHFIHSHVVADFVGGLDGARPLGDAVDRFVASHALPETTGGTLINTIERLETLGLVSAVPGA